MDTAPTTVVKFRSPAEIVGLLPYRLGFHPTDSVVIMCLHGPRKRSGLVLRHDLVPATHQEQLVKLLAWHVKRNGADAAIVTIYTSEPDEEGALPRREFVEALGDRMGVEVVEALLVRDGRWWSYNCRNPTCCAPAGTPVPPEPEGAAQRYAAEVAAEGRAVLPDRAALEESIRPPRNAVADKARVQALDAASDAFLRTHHADGLAACREQTLELLRSTARRWADGARDLTFVDAARIVLGLRDKWCRDHAATLALEVDRESYLPLLVELCRHADAPDAAPVCTVLAWVAYMHGDGALANVAVDRALTLEPDYEMARLILTGLEGQVPPDDVVALTRGTRDDLEALARGEQPLGPPRPHGQRKRGGRARGRQSARKRKRRRRRR